MAETADSVIVALEARTGDFNTRITQSARVVDQSMSAIERSASRAEATVKRSGAQIVESHTRMGASGMMLQHIIRSTADQFASGAPPMMIFSQHIAQLGEAAALSGSSMGRFGTVMAGPWGFAVTAGIALLGTLISRIGGASDALGQAIQKLRENAQHTDAARLAQETWARTLPGIIAAIRDETHAIEEQNRSLAQNQQLALDRARGQLSSLQGRLHEAEQAVADARQARDDASAEDRRNQALYPESAAGPTLESAATAVLHQAEVRLASIRQGIADAQQLVRDTQVPIAEREAGALSDPIVAITERYNGLRDAAIDAAHGNDRLTASLAQTLAAINRHRDADLAAERERQQAARQRERDLVRPATGAVLSQFGASRAGVPLNGRLVAGRRHDGVDLRGALGDPVVAPEGGIARVLNAPGGLGLYVEIRADSGARDLLGHLSSANIHSGDRVAAGQLVGLIGNSGNAQGGPTHLHWQRQVSGQWVDPMRSVGSSGAAQEAQQEAARARELADRRAHDEAHFQEELAGLNTDILNARRRQVQTEEEATAADIAAIRAEQTQRDQRIRDEAAERTRRDASQTAAANAEAGVLLARSAELAQTKIDARNALTQQRLDVQRIEIAQRDLNDQESVLQARAQLARTAMERRDIELRLLGLQHQEEILAIRKQQAQQNLSPGQRAQLDRDEAAANARYGFARQNTMRQTAGPLEAFLNSVPQGARELNEALQGVAVNGLQSLNDGLAQAASRFLHLGGVAGQVLDQIIADMVRLILRQAELAAFGGGGGGGGIFGTILDALRGGGGGYSGELLPGSGSLIPGFATGGAQMVGGFGGTDNNVVSINGQPRFRASGDETLAVIPQGKQLGSFGGRAASPAAAGQPHRVTIAIQSTGDFEAKVTEIAGHVAVEIGRAAAPQIIAGAKAETIRALSRPGLNRN